MNVIFNVEKKQFANLGDLIATSEGKCYLVIDTGDTLYPIGILDIRENTVANGFGSLDPLKLGSYICPKETIVEIFDKERLELNIKTMEVSK